MKDWGKFKKCLPVFGLIPAAVLAMCTAVSLSGYTAPVLTIELTPAATTVTSEITAASDNKKETTKTQTTATASALTVEKIADADSYKNGTYTGTGTGFAGPIQVQVVIKQGKIADISIVSTTDDKPFIDSAASLLDTIISRQTSNVDTISGATYSSVGLIEAVRDALQQAGGDESSYSALPVLSASGSSNTQAPSVQKVTEPSAYRDGTYIGTGTGFAGPITVEVAVAGGKISGITMISHSDDSPYIDSASALLNTIIARQTTNVDTVSGATFSSAGLIEAVRNALSDASAAAATTVVTEQNQEPNGTVTGTFPCPDGVYLGTGEGYRSEITVAVSLKGGTIDTILVLDEDEDEPFFQKAEVIVDAVLKKQTTDVDTVSGATFSSEGILEAISNALNAASSGITTTTTTATSQATETTTSGRTETVTTAPAGETTAAPETTVSTSTTQTIYADGEYAVNVTCYPDDAEDFAPYTLSVIVRIENDSIVEIRNIEGSGSDYDPENDWYISRAINGTSKYPGTIEQILEKQTTQGIDAVSGATCTSDAIIEAAAKALSAALKS
ncbi:MAG: FMN-binding protein [Ruminococcus sp.]|nr:FMN-binding protein [Ruminococcus sp.]